jgi:hypothetical protein
VKTDYSLWCKGIGIPPFWPIIVSALLALVFLPACEKWMIRPEKVINCDSVDTSVSSQYFGSDGQYFCLNTTEYNSTSDPKLYTTESELQYRIDFSSQSRFIRVSYLEPFSLISDRESDCNPFSFAAYNDHRSGGYIEPTKLAFSAFIKLVKQYELCFDCVEGIRVQAGRYVLVECNSHEQSAPCHVYFGKYTSDGLVQQQVITLSRSGWNDAMLDSCKLIFDDEEFYMLINSKVLYRYFEGSLSKIDLEWSTDSHRLAIGKDRGLLILVQDARGGLVRTYQFCDGTYNNCGYTFYCKGKLVNYEQTERDTVIMAINKGTFVYYVYDNENRKSWMWSAKHRSRKQQR